jgi:outer membrane protein OmpA-like peptidoglycan-associated protein
VVQTIAPAAIKYVFNNYQSTVLFDTDKYNLSADTKGSLRQLAMASDKNEIIRVQLAGHADSRGTHAYNMHLSEHRMLAVAEFLATFNILPTSLFAKGETDPVLVNNIEDLSLSRRVNIILTTRQKVAAQ